MVGPSDTTGGEEVLRGEIEVLAGVGIVLGLPVMVVRHDEAAALDDRTALPHGLGPMAALPELDPGPTLRWYSLCRTAGSTGPERAGRPAERREEVIWLRLDRSSRSCVLRSWRRDWRDVLLLVARVVVVLVALVDRALLTAVRAELVPVLLLFVPMRRWFDAAVVDDDDAAMREASLPVVARGTPATAAASGRM